MATNKMKIGEIKLGKYQTLQAIRISGDSLNQWSYPMVMDFFKHQKSLYATAEFPLERLVVYLLLNKNEHIAAGISLVSQDGVGVLGNAYAPPMYHTQGALAALIGLFVEECTKDEDLRVVFASNGATNDDDVSIKKANGPYLKHGFVSLEKGSNFIRLDCKGTAKAFEKAFFAKSGIVIEPLGWQHFATVTPLFTSAAVKGVIRCAGLSLFRQTVPDVPLLRLIADGTAYGEGVPPYALVLRSKKTNAVVGMAMRSWEKQMHKACLIDIFCHPRFWKHAPALLKELRLPDNADRFLVMADSSCRHKMALFLRTGFVPRALDSRLKADTAGTTHVTSYYLERACCGRPPLFPPLPGEAPPMRPSDAEEYFPDVVSIGRPFDEDKCITAARKKAFAAAREARKAPPRVPPSPQDRLRGMLAGHMEEEMIAKVLKQTVGNHVLPPKKDVRRDPKAAAADLLAAVSSGKTKTAPASCPPATSASRQKQCGLCGAHKGAQGEALLRCTACRNAHYCSRQCQRKHWKDHKPVCKRVARAEKKKTLPTRAAKKRVKAPPVVAPGLTMAPKRDGPVIEFLDDDEETDDA